MTDWKNCPGNTYVSYAYADDVDPRIVKMLKLYPFFFDDDYWYWVPKPKGRSRHKNYRRARVRAQGHDGIVKRSPLWTYPAKSVPTEHPKDPCQKKLLSISEN